MLSTLKCLILRFFIVLLYLYFTMILFLRNSFQKHNIHILTAKIDLFCLQTEENKAFLVCQFIKICLTCLQKFKIFVNSISIKC